MNANSKVASKDRFRSFAELAANRAAEIDYRITVRHPQCTRTAIIAPHGGSIEHHTSSISTAIAGDDFGLYLFEGLDENGSFEDLHITSHRFDEPRCLDLIAACDIVVALHGYAGDGMHLLVGGLDQPLIAALTLALEPLDIDVRTEGHAFPGRHPGNVCNRGKLGRGVQIELSDALRGSEFEPGIVEAIRTVLLNFELEPKQRR